MLGHRGERLKVDRCIGHGPAELREVLSQSDDVQPLLNAKRPVSREADAGDGLAGLGVPELGVTGGVADMVLNGPDINEVGVF